jgi:hypothetical protein
MTTKIITLILCFCFACLMNGCAATKPPTTVLSSAGTIGPKLIKPLPQDQRILVISALRDIHVDIVSENIFIYNILGSTTLPAALINPIMNHSLINSLQENSYQNLQAAVINTPDPLNTTEIHMLTALPDDSLSAPAQQSLKQQINQQNVDIIVLLTQSGSEPLAFDVKCELSKNNLYYYASIEPHLYLYKIYVIDAHSLKILTWITGSANGELQDLHLCRPTSLYRPRDFNNLNSTVIHKLRAAVGKDLLRTLGS